jgi:hypothetical protein
MNSIAILYNARENVCTGLPYRLLNSTVRVDSVKLTHGEKTVFASLAWMCNSENGSCGEQL